MKTENNYPYPFFDMHLHILPGIDDGPSSLDEVFKMLEMERQQGVLYLCATSHFSVKNGCDQKKLLEAYSSVSGLMREHFPDMRLYLGHEIFYSSGVIAALDRKEAKTYNCSSYVLTEFSPDEAYSVVYDSVQTLVRSGYIPVLAHVERLHCLWKQTGRMDELKSMFIPFQMNTSSLCGSGFNLSVRYCRDLVADGYIDLLGTDAHSSGWRPPVYKEAALWIEKHCGEGVLHRLAFENPRNILDGKLLQI